MFADQRMVPLDRVDPNPWQTRQIENSEHIAELAESIRLNGLMQVPTGREMPYERVQLAFGHSRLAAFNLLASQGHKEFDNFPVNIRSLDDEQMAIMAFTENEKRHDLNPVERARAIQNLLIGFGWSQQDVADKLGIDRSSVSNALRMLRMPVDVLQSVAEGTLPVRSAMALIPYYEITPLEMTALLERYRDAEDFAALARSGQVNSDTIRKQVDEYMKHLHPAPEELFATPQLVVIPVEPVEGECLGGFDETNPGEGIEPEELGESETGEPEEEPEEGPTLLTTEKSADTAPAAQVKKPSPSVPLPKGEGSTAPAVSKDTVFSVTWFANGGAMVGIRWPGEAAPRMIWRSTLTAADFPELLSLIGIE